MYWKPIRVHQEQFHWFRKYATSLWPKLQQKLYLVKNLRRLKFKKIPYFGVKQAVFPFNMFQEVDPLLGPEMRSTGEVLGMADSFGLAFFKAQEATKIPFPVSGPVLISVNDQECRIGYGYFSFTGVPIHFGSQSFRYKPQRKHCPARI